MKKVITRENIPPRVAGMFYQAVVAAVLLYGSESWVLPAAQLARLKGFHVECARRLTGMKPRKRGGKWVYPKSAEVLAKAGLKPLGHYIQKRRATVAATIEGRPVLRECRGAERLRGTPVRPTWWEQCLDPPEEEEEDRTRRLPAWMVPQVPRGPMSEEATEADRRQWARAHVADYHYTAPAGGGAAAAPPPPPPPTTTTTTPPTTTPPRPPRRRHLPLPRPRQGTPRHGRGWWWRRRRGDGGQRQ